MCELLQEFTFYICAYIYVCSQISTCAYIYKKLCVCFKRLNNNNNLYAFDLQAKLCYIIRFQDYLKQEKAKNIRLLEICLMNLIFFFIKGCTI